MSTKQNISYDIILVDKLFFEIQGIGVDFMELEWMTRISWRKEQKKLKSLKAFNTLNYA